MSTQTTKRELSRQPGAPTTHDADAYSWAGFCCPYCRANSIVLCGAGHLVCDGTAEIKNGDRFFECFCGQAGIISGQIKSIKGRQSNMQSGTGEAKATTPQNAELHRNPAKPALGSPNKGKLRGPTL